MCSPRLARHGSRRAQASPGSAAWTPRLTGAIGSTHSGPRHGHPMPAQIHRTSPRDRAASRYSPDRGGPSARTPRSRRPPSSRSTPAPPVRTARASRPSPTSSPNVTLTCSGTAATLVSVLSSWYFCATAVPFLGSFLVGHPSTTARQVSGGGPPPENPRGLGQPPYPGRWSLPWEVDDCPCHG